MENLEEKKALNFIEQIVEEEIDPTNLLKI